MGVMTFNKRLDTDIVPMLDRLRSKSGSATAFSGGLCDREKTERLLEAL